MKIRWTAENQDMYIIITSDNTGVYYRFKDERKISRRTKIYLYIKKNGSTVPYFIARRKIYYLDDFNFYPQY